MNRHFVEMLNALSDANAEFLIIGAHAVAAHGFYRSTKDIDIWIRPSPENVARVWQALHRFGAPMHQITVEDLLTVGTIYQIGVDPMRIDILNAVEPLAFVEAWSNRAMIEVDGRTWPFLGRDDLIRSKRAAGRPHDLRDIEALEQF
jgi:uncharacterized nucleotidyltransferase DUF6036